MRLAIFQIRSNSAKQTGKIAKLHLLAPPSKPAKERRAEMEAALELASLDRIASHRFGSTWFGARRRSGGIFEILIFWIKSEPRGRAKRKATLYPLRYSWRIVQSFAGAPTASAALGFLAFSLWRRTEMADIVACWLLGLRRGRIYVQIWSAATKNQATTHQFAGGARDVAESALDASAMQRAATNDDRLPSYRLAAVLTLSQRAT